MRSSLGPQATSLAVHGLLAALLVLLAPVAHRSVRNRERTIVEYVEMAVPAQPQPETATRREEEPEPPQAARRERLPERVVVRRVERPKPFRATPEVGRQEAPPAIEAVEKPTTELPTLSENDIVQISATGDYSTTSVATGSMDIAAGPRGGRGGSGTGVGEPGPLRGQTMRDFATTPEWQIVAQPEPLNDDDFAPRFPAAALDEGRDAVVVLEIDIDHHGRVTRAIVTRRAGHGFDEEALDYVRRLRFRPARSLTGPVPTRIRWTVHFYAND